ESQLHDKLRTRGGGSPEAAAVSIFGEDGSLLASSRFSPPPAVSIANRDDFTGIRDGKVLEHVSKNMVGQVASESGFNTGGAPRTADCGFASLVSPAFRPGGFIAFYLEL